MSRERRVEGSPRPLGRGVSTGMRLAISGLLGIIVAVAVLLLGAPSYAPAIGWDVAAAILLAWVWFTIWPMSSHDTSTHATREDPTRGVSDIVVLTAAVVSLAAVWFFLVEAGSARGATRDILATTGVGTIALSWLTVHTVFTLRYAMLYYSVREAGIEFNQKSPPRYSDFAYLAFTLGMTFQVSDTDLQTPAIRATALRHALLSYVFGTVIVATTINLLAGLGNH